jgi:ribosomal protein L30E
MRAGVKFIASKGRREPELKLVVERSFGVRAAAVIDRDNARIIGCDHIGANAEGCAK